MKNWKALAIASVVGALGLAGSALAGSISISNPTGARGYVNNYTYDNYIYGSYSGAVSADEIVINIRPSGGSTWYWNNSLGGLNTASGGHSYQIWFEYPGAGTYDLKTLIGNYSTGDWVTSGSSDVFSNQVYTD